MEDFIGSIINSNTNSLLASFVFGVLVAFNPCTIATNVTAFTFIQDKNKEQSNIFLYIIGRSISYILLGILIYIFADILSFSQFIQHYFGKIIGPIFLILGILLLNIVHFHFFDNKCKHVVLSDKIKGKKYTPFLIGLWLAFAFCPFSAMIYFGCMTPMMFSTNNVCLPISFALGCGIPLIPLGFLVSRGINKMTEFSQKHSSTEKWIRRLFAVLLIVAGILLIIEYYFE